MFFYISIQLLLWKWLVSESCIKSQSVHFYRLQDRLLMFVLLPFKDSSALRSYAICALLQDLCALCCSLRMVCGLFCRLDDRLHTVIHSDVCFPFNRMSYLQRFFLPPSVLHVAENHWAYNPAAPVFCGASPHALLGCRQHAGVASLVWGVWQRFEKARSKGELCAKKAAICEREKKMKKKWIKRRKLWIHYNFHWY